MRNIFAFVLLIALSLSQISCEKFDLSTQKDEIKDRLRELGTLDEAIETDEGVFIVFTTPGTGTENPMVSSTIDVIYEARLFDSGEIVDSSYGSIVRQELSNTIFGWQYALPYFTTGAQAEIYIPAVHAYGTTQDRPGSTGVTIEKGSILEFTVKLHDFF